MIYKDLINKVRTIRVWPTKPENTIDTVAEQLRNLRTQGALQHANMCGVLSTMGDIKDYLTRERDNLTQQIAVLEGTTKNLREAVNIYVDAVERAEERIAGLKQVVDATTQRANTFELTVGDLRAELNAAKLIISIQQSMISVRCTLAEQMKISELSLKSLDKFGVNKASFIGSFPAGDALIPDSATTLAAHDATTTASTEPVEPVTFEIADKLAAGVEVSHGDIVEATISPTEQEFNEAMGVLVNGKTE